MIVVDTNVVAYLLLPGPLTGAAEAWFEAVPDWAAPPLWRSELPNVLTGYLRLGTLPLEQVIVLQDQAEELLGAMEISVTSEEVFTPAALISTPFDQVEITGEVNSDHASSLSHDEGTVHRFPRELFLVEGELPQAAV